jgi:MFS family permease
MTGPATTDRRRLVLVAMTLANAMILVDQTAVPLALPDIMQTFGIGTASALAGIALIPATVPMVIVAPLAGRWYDRTGGRPRLAAGFGFLALSGVLLAIGVGHNSYLWLLPGLLAYGIGLAIVLTVNDPVSLDTVPDSDSGQVSGVSATAEQGGGAIGIALLYVLFHSAYISRLYSEIESKNLPRLGEATGSAFRDQIQAAEQTGLRPGSFDPALTQYLVPAEAASDFGYTVTFLAVTVLSLLAMGAVAWLVRKPPPEASPVSTVPGLPLQRPT